MASTYSPNLRLELIGTGEQQGTWGATTNTNLGTLLEEAIGGYTSVTVADAGDTTLTTANGAADQSRNMTINLTGTLTASRNVIVPAIEKVYLVKNATSGGFAVTVKVSGQTGVSVANGTTMLVFVDGTDVRQAGAQVGASNSLVLAAGSASAPSLTTTGDTNTGLWFPAADTLSASTGGTERMRIDSSGRVLIGTTSAASGYVLQPYGKIYAGDDTNVTPDAFWSGQLTIRGNGYAGGLSLDATGMWVGHNSSGRALLFATDETERMRVDFSGNVGIGTSSPNNKLTVYGASGAGISVNNSTTGTTSTSGLQLAIDSTTGGYVWNYSAGILSFGTGGGERFRIDASNNVLVTSSGGLGYGTGSGGTVTQATDKATAVTLNKTNGRIITTAAALAGSTAVQFQVTNSTVAATDTVIINLSSGDANIGLNYQVWVGYISAGAFVVTLLNRSGGSRSEALTLNFSVIKATTS